MTVAGLRSRSCRRRARRSSCSRNSINAARFTPTGGSCRSIRIRRGHGASVGRWEGDTFVVETAGFKEGSWLDNNGHPHTEALRTTERFRRINFGRMELDGHRRRPEGTSRPWMSDTLHFLAAARHGAARASL